MSKADQAYEILKARIMDGHYGPGYRLVIDQLAREHGISSVPWRESLRRLEAEGWVDIVPNVGALVKTFDTDAWQRTLRLLARIEGLATSLSAPSLTSDDIAEARRLNQAMRDALANFDTSHFGRMNREFHELLCSRCDDERLTGMVHHEWSRLELIRRSAFFYAPGRALASLTEHDQLIDLIEGGADADMIETAARRHELNNLTAVMEDAERNRAAQA
ncbi:GntR family transcriptional regulator [Demequina lignilytica]|uniref:GntR family transcriptional regulator n=1 Tax=Demequina lignilytica TaxID=3051663 RepID=A0AAW7M2I9_9MICO|nr:MULTISPECIES: GntR family transcriptional regulator [unclassified Demequina]MDN4478964.1 GntR family transcriptional regulator [Demequina sp. SYSU T00039-1]MDN4482992.1 GntR family transcriptional regulator [Demequina sp. SYSU T0a273]MDN4488839.1 GntR family transcriptional regulator [Demequina sp. SYSU T00039]MDN4491448.1 GntR family transcriptional regulator [Demequina sp. SYSU T00068]